MLHIVSNTTTDGTRMKSEGHFKFIKAELVQSVFVLWPIRQYVEEEYRFTYSYKTNKETGNF